ncbi:GlcNAc transferase [Tieghemostelium lacteum]|uniref:protein xylosyltransferase n=1 Tax=Tieghemostelium lacteum TaxID=361077 RepID=A0A152A6H9_TIELA|nr:GlcNAc transferase [Tieghemostelium lacteum]|eukprot:KYR01838.1 GlcNAc transferase [Tieghemostelium lacteum]
MNYSYKYLGILIIFTIVSITVLVTFNSNSIVQNSQPISNKLVDNNNLKVEDKWKYYRVRSNSANANVSVHYNIPKNFPSKHGNNAAAKKTKTESSGIETSSMKTMVCKNGGIGFQGECICTYPFSGKECEISKEDDCKSSPLKFSVDNVNASSCTIDPTIICCSSKHRNSQKLFHQYSNNQNVELKRLLSLYGPWDENDKSLFTYLLQTEDESANSPMSLKNKDFDHSQFDFEKYYSISKTNLAFVILLKHFDSDTFEKLFTTIYRSKHYYVIHVDRDANKKEVEKFKSYMSNIKNAENIAVLNTNYYGNISPLYAEITAYDQLFKMAEKRAKNISSTDQIWSHVINLNYNHYPTKSFADLEMILSLPANINRNYIGEYNSEKGSNNYEKNWIECNNSRIYIDSHHCGDFKNIVNSIDKTKITEGSQWHIISNRFARYLISNIEPLERLLSMKFILQPEELFFQASKNYKLKDQHWDRSNYRYSPKNGKELKFNELQNYRHPHYFATHVNSDSLRHDIVTHYLKKKMADPFSLV